MIVRAVGDVLDDDFAGVEASGGGFSGFVCWWLREHVDSSRR